jgi:hypothetical protein
MTIALAELNKRMASLADNADDLSKELLELRVDNVGYFWRIGRHMRDLVTTVRTTPTRTLRGKNE